MPDDDTPHDPAEGPDVRPAANPMPFLVALVGFVVVAVLAFVFLREDEDGELVRPERFEQLDERRVRVRPETEGTNLCTTVERAQVEYDAERVYLELLVVSPECEDGYVPVEVVVDIELPEAIGSRRVVGGVGRQHLPCRPGAADGPEGLGTTADPLADFVCAPDG